MNRNSWQFRVTQPHSHPETKSKRYKDIFGSLAKIPLTGTNIVAIKKPPGLVSRPYQEA
jgi:hypothetical protein